MTARDYILLAVIDISQGVLSCPAALSMHRCIVLLRPIACLPASPDRLPPLPHSPLASHAGDFQQVTISDKLIIPLQLARKFTSNIGTVWKWDRSFRIEEDYFGIVKVWKREGLES